MNDVYKAFFDWTMYTIAKYTKNLICFIFLNLMDKYTDGNSMKAFNFK